MKTVNFVLSQGDAFFRFNFDVEDTQVNAQFLSVTLTEAVLKFHERYTKFCKGKAKSYNLKFGKSFRLSAYIEGVRGINGTFYHEAEGIFGNVETQDGVMQLTARITKVDTTKVSFALFLEDWMSEIFAGKRTLTMEEVLNTYTNTEVCEDCEA